jgi:hypothetical protein
MLGHFIPVRRIANVLDKNTVQKIFILEQVHEGLAMGAILGVHKYHQSKVLNSMAQGLFFFHGKGLPHHHGRSGGKNGRSGGLDGLVAGALGQMERSATLAISSLNSVVPHTIVVMRKRIVAIVIVIVGQLHILHGRHNGRNWRTPHTLEVVGV